MSASPLKDVAVFIGRIQPFHNGHLALLQRALSEARHLIVVLGSAHQARTPKNPWTWQERAEMIRLALPEGDRTRCSFLPIRDHYDEGRWIKEVRAGVAAICDKQLTLRHPAVVVVGHFKDATSAYLGNFQGWDLVSVDRLSPIDGVHIRNILFSSKAGGREAAFSAMAGLVPASTVHFLRAWCALPFLPALVEEWEALRGYDEAWASAPYPPVFVTVDAVVTCASHVLLIRRGRAPGKGLYAVPGGFIEQRETALQSAIRELREETQLSLLELSLLDALKASAVFDHPDRSQRGRTITHAFHFDLRQHSFPDIEAADDALSAHWVALSELPSLEDQFHDDHFHMLDHFLSIIPARADTAH